MPKSAVPDDFEQLKVSFIDPIQHDYEAIRPVVLGADTLRVGSHQVQIDRTVLGDKARRFLAQGVDVPLHMCGVQAYGMVVRKASLPSVKMREQDTSGCWNN